MSELPALPELNPLINPEFTDQRSCRQWLALLPMINVPQAHRELLAALTDLTQVALEPLERLKTLEMLRENIIFLQDANARKYMGKPMPLAAQELNAWQANVAMWQVLASSYQIVLQDCLQGEASVKEHAALVNHRCIRYTGLAIREHALAYRSVPVSLWQALHGFYLVSEAGWALRGVKDSQNTNAQASSCTAAYVQALLLDTVRPSGNSAKLMLWLDRLLDRWANYVTVHKEMIGAATSQVSVDLDGAGILHQTPPKAARARYLDTSQLAKSIAKRIKLLRMGEAPSQLGLGEEFVADVCISVMVSCFQQWCKGGEERAYQRRTASGSAQVVCSLDSIFHCLTGRPLPQESVSQVRGQNITAIQMFGHSGLASADAAQIPPCPSEQWGIFDQSAFGFGLSRAAGAGMRVAHNQLLAVRPDDAAGFSVGMVRWIALSEDDELSIGLRMLPGLPKAAAMRAVGLSPTGRDNLVPALFLPTMAALRTQESLLVPIGWFKQGRIVEIFIGEQGKRLRFESLIERGPDFERISFSNA